MTTNRLLDDGRRHGTGHRRSHPLGAPGWAMSHSAAQRVLVVLIENGGVDLGLPELVRALIDKVPGASAVITDSIRDALVTRLRTWLRETTDTLLESAELALNHYSGASPEHYGEVVVLRDSTATFAELRSTLFAATRAGKVVDLLVLTHGSRNYISTVDGIDAARIRSLRTDFGGPLSIRTVYMMNCVAASLNQAWLDVGARASAGSHANNYLPEPTTHFFWTAWRSGQSFESAVTGAYRRTVDTMNRAVRSAVSALIPLVGDSIAARIDLSTLDFVVASRPEVVGDGTLTISRDTLPPPPTASGQSLVTTVLPPGLARGLGATGSTSTASLVSAAGRAFIERWERPLIGEDEEARAELSRRISQAERFLSDRVGTPLTQAQLDALASFALGIGAGAFARSTVLRLAAAGDLAGVPPEMRRWTKVRRNGDLVDSQALAERRAAEAEMFAGPERAVPASREVREYAWQQNPAVAVTAAEAIQIGLGAAAIVQSQVNAFPGGTLSVSYDKQQRLLTPEARLRMPGATRPKRTYTRDLLRFPQIRSGTAYAQLVITWEGNDYGEISTPVITRDPDRSSEWTRSEASLAITAVNRIPTGSDPRAWPLWYHYEGSFDPVGNGKWEIQGDFEINAFGALLFHNHRVTSRSLLDVALDVDPNHFRGADVTAAVPSIPDDQMAYLRENVPR